MNENFGLDSVLTRRPGSTAVADFRPCSANTYVHWLKCRAVLCPSKKNVDAGGRLNGVLLFLSRRLVPARIIFVPPQERAECSF